MNSLIDTSLDHTAIVGDNLSIGRNKKGKERKKSIGDPHFLN